MTATGHNLRIADDRSGEGAGWPAKSLGLMNVLVTRGGIIKPEFVATMGGPLCSWFCRARSPLGSGSSQ